MRELSAFFLAYDIHLRVDEDSRLRAAALGAMIGTRFLCDAIDRALPDWAARYAQKDHPDNLG
jgi:hypothetical protein